MRLLYTVLLYLATPLVLARLAWRARRAPAYRRRWAQRFGFFPALSARPRIWVHAVSVGETQAAAPLIRQLMQGYPDYALLVTSTTPTGSAQVRRLFGDTLEHVYLPYDLPDCVRRFYLRTRPCIAIIMETEIWPNLYACLHHNAVALVIANARLSDRSARGYQRLGGLTRQTLACVDLVAAREPRDAQRFSALGAPRVEVMGNIKFDMQVNEAQVAQGLQLRADIGARRPVWIGASTHEGEDAQVLEAFVQIRAAFPTACLILVPRHPERFDAVYALCVQQGMRTLRRSLGEIPSDKTDILLGDSMGELMMFYAAADVAFVGGSLVATGGHNPLEPAALKRAVVSGPHTFNFDDIYPQLMAADAVSVVKNASDLAVAVKGLFDSPADCYKKAANAHAVFVQNNGALTRLIEHCDPWLQACER